jgi:hypothetical protein
VRAGTSWRRNLAENRFSGSVPSAISALTALTKLYAPALQVFELLAHPPKVGVHCESAVLKLAS